MQSVPSGWTAEERDSTRQIAHNLQVSWHKQSTLSNRTFTIGVSTIGGNDAIGINPGAIGNPANYRYFDESAYVTQLSWEHGLNMPTGGLTEGLAEAVLDNTSQRFLPRYMGGHSELYTAILPTRPVVINAGFKIGGVDNTLAQFAGIITKQPQVDQVNRSVLLQASDYIDYFQHKYLDQTVMWTGLRTDQALTNVASQLGMNTAQYDFDYGINVIPFAVFNSGTKFSDIIHQLVEAENGHFYQDKNGIFKFHNRQWGDSAPFNQVQRIILTGQVISAQSPNEDHLINVVEITGSVYEKQPTQALFSLPAGSSITVPPNSTTDQFFQFQDPVLQLTEPTDGGSLSFYVANGSADNSGTDMTVSIQVKNLGLFSQSVKYRFTNTAATTVYVTQFVLSGRVAHKTSSLYYREQDDSSVTAYQEHLLQINNDFIQNPGWAQSYARMILNDFSDVENLQSITIRALPELQLGDLVSWQGRYWKIYNIKAKLDPSVGFIQELLMLQRTITTYFRIGISSIGGSDRIAP